MEGLEGEDANCCRICRLPESPGNLLFSPCKCSGSIKFVHQDCLLSWLNHSGHQHCELCRHRFEFRPVYAPDAPSRLPWMELIWGLAVKSMSGLAVGARVLIVIFTWLFCVPLVTCWMWRLAFLTSLSQGLHNLSQRLQPVYILADCVQGSLISSALIFMVLFTTYTADHIRAYWQIMQPQPPTLPAEPFPGLPPPGPLQDQQVQEGAAEDGLAQGTPAAAAGEEASSSGADFDLSTWGSDDEEVSSSIWNSSGSFSRAQNTSEGSRWQRRRRSADDRDTGSSRLQHRGAGAHRRASGEEERSTGQRQHQPVALPGPPPAPVMPAHVGAVNEGLMGGGAAQPAERGQDREFAFNELIGLEGPIRVLLENATTVIFTTWAFMTAALWMPFMLGRIVIPTVLGLRYSLRGSDAAAATAATAAANATSLFQQASGPAGLPPVAAGSATLDTDLWEGLGSKLALLPLMNRLAAEFEAHLSGPDLSDWVCLGVGYALLFLLATLAFWSLVVWKLLWRSNIREGLRGQRDILRAAFADISHQTRVHLGYAAVMVKVSLVLTLELTLLPALHGCWVDLCMLPLFDANWGDRTAWFRSSPVSFLLVHWVLGMAFLMGIATFLSILRQQLRPGALPFFKDPYEGDEEPMRALMVLGLGQQLEREACALAALASVTVVTLHLPLRLTGLLLPRMLPLQFSLTSPFAEAPTDLLLFHFLLPLTVPRLRIRFLVVKALQRWLRLVSWALDLGDYLLPTPAGGVAPVPGDELQPPVVIPHGLPGEDEDPRIANWHTEVNAARQRSGRLLTLLAAMLGSLVLVNAAVLMLPLLTGRLAFWAAKMPAQHDLYNAAAGAYTLWGVALLGQQLHRIAGADSIHAAAEVALRWTLLVVRLTGMAVLGLGLLPVLVGLFLELTVLPFRLEQGETPSFFLYQDWAIGLLALKMGFRFLLGWPQLNPHGPQPGPQLQPGNDGAGSTNGLLQPVKTLQAQLRRLKARGLTRISFADAFRSVLWPLILFWGVAVSVPYVLARGLGPRLPFASEQALHTVFMFGWLCEGAVLVGCVSAVHVLTALERLGSKLRDQRYLLHRELINVSD